ncbi:MAG TPA: NUMOD4 motif-containing HNH endonuclease [Ramlibacter sp.]|uniref:NUMOD4 motif-containing HNH endonuclease n=1 Tax=Ramlibacter sp. TaxID=1917967 RepID=UPI002D7E2A89|nr:NUMOD4 motif-containing HNH endonuclease [Ramlibacter sp.]HET8744630.1 NUMOD4 motif-containing HNH endonuclease [Ramlibacter sp.]
MRWVAIAGWPGYSVSDAGLVRSEARMVRHPSGGEKLVRERLLAPCKNNAGYVFVTLSQQGQTATRAVHLLVLEAFAGPCPPGMECRHLDGDKGNAALANLVWGTPTENGQDRLRHGTQAQGERHGASKVTAARAALIRGDPRPQDAIAADHKVSQATVSNIKRGRHWAVRQGETS